MLYIVIAAAWCMLAYVVLAICRASATSDDAHTLELAERFADGAHVRREQALARAAAERRYDGHGEARRAAG